MQIQITCFSESGQNYGMNSTIFTRRFLRKAFISYFNSPNLFPKYNINLILGNRLVVKTTNLESRTCMDTGFDRLHLLIYKGKVFIGSFGCRNDCLTVHFNCRKRRNAGFSPPGIEVAFLFHMLYNTNLWGESCTYLWRSPCFIFALLILIRCNPSVFCKPFLA